MTHYTFTTDLSATYDHKEFFLLQRSLRDAAEAAGLNVTSEVAMNEAGTGVTMTVSDDRDEVQVALDLQENLEDALASVTVMSFRSGDVTVSTQLPLEITR